MSRCLVLLGLSMLLAPPVPGADAASRLLPTGAFAVEHELTLPGTPLVIYEAIDEVTRALEGLLTPDTKEVIIGHAEIRQVFRSSKFGNIAGCIQQDGETERGAMARLLRDNVVVYSGKIATVRREKDEVKSVSTGFECGLKLERFDDLQVGDIIETYKLESIAKTLD